MKKIGIIVLSVLLISLTACSSTELSGYTYSDYISDTKGDMSKPATTQTTASETSEPDATTSISAEESSTAAIDEQVPSKPDRRLPETTSDETPKTAEPPTESALEENIDIDLAAMSVIMAYSEIYNMLCYPDGYIGKTVKISGQYACYENPETKKLYHACIITDATACCAQGFEFTLAEESSEYPSSGDSITIIGTFNIYWEGKNSFAELINSRFV